MNFTIGTLSIAIFFLLLMSDVCGQGGGPNAEEYFRQADIYRKNFKPDSAILYYEKASIEFQLLGKVDEFVNSYNQIGIILTRQDQYERAKNYLEKALNIGLSSLDSNLLSIATTYISLGVIFRAEGNFIQSLDYHYKALTIRLQRLGEYNAEVATSYGNIGNVYISNKDFDQAIFAHTKAMDIRNKLFGPESAEIIESYAGLGNAFREKKEYKRAIEYFEKALDNKILQRGPGHKDLVKYQQYLSEVYYLSNNKEKGDYYKSLAEEILKK
ncbi:MAG: tetratricopeptide repeat protein [Saprospiraceae bacterium]|nr:tetratricopeptide repeat protein [Saprospiraceae bacterium]MBK7811597.1 tetratricopeptide repeat protein [Saprospiraceae bacterium]MBK9631690.1 tetratricopeptide repeat protein [Saprospiraceae bacterium]